MSSLPNPTLPESPPTPGAEGGVGTSEAERNFRELDKRIQEAINHSIPVGCVIATGRSAAPDGWLLCDGSAVSRTTYAALFDAISTTYGVGDGSTTFNVPDLRGRVIVGVDGAAARIAANDALGNSGGTATHTLTTQEIPAHTHPPLSNDNFVTVTGGVGVVGSGGTAAGVESTTGSTGGGQAHNNLQPYQVLNHIIKAT